MASLRELQKNFAAALRSDAANAEAGVRPLANLEVYRHNIGYQFGNALGLSYPVLRRRVGDDFFRQLAFHYRQRHPSRSGDLQWVGREFPAFLDQHLAGGEYAWLADLARLEWARELAVISELRPAIVAEALARFAPGELERLVFDLQPSLRLVRSAFPVFTIWLANQGENAPPVDQSIGKEQGLVLQGFDGVEIRRLEPGLFSYLYELSQGATLGAAISEAGLDESALLKALQFCFAEGLVCGLRVQGSENR